MTFFLSNVLTNFVLKTVQRILRLLHEYTSTATMYLQNDLYTI